MNDKLNNSLRKEHMIQMSNISLDDSFNLERLKTFSSQNFTAILNNPIPQYTFMDDLYTKVSENFYYYYYTEGNNDFEKFNDVGSPRSQSTAKSSKTFKDLISENYDEYVGKIEKFLPTYKKNHSSPHHTNHSILLNCPDSTKSIVNNNKIYNIIPKEFFDNHYRIKDESLNLKLMNLFTYSEELSEKCGDIDYELNKIITNSTKLFNYINDNLNFDEKINNFLGKITMIKHKKHIIKEKFLLNSIKTIRLGIKKDHLFKLKKMMQGIKILREMLDIIKVLINQPSKFQTVLELINRSNNLLENLQKSKTKLNLVKVLADEINKYSKKISEKLLDEFLRESIDLGKRIKFREKNSLCEEKDKSIIEENFDFTLIKSSNIFNIVSNTIVLKEYDDEEMFKKPREYLNLMLKIDLELILRINPSIRKFNYDSFSSIIEKVNQIFYEATDSKIPVKLDIFKSLENTEQNIYLYFVTKILSTSIDFTKTLMKVILTEIITYMQKENYDPKKIEKYEKLYSSELKKIRKTCRDDLTKEVERIYYWNVEICQKLGLNSFLKSLQYNKYCLRSIVPKLKNLENIFLKQEENFIILFFSKKEQELQLIIENDDWKEVNIPSIYQNMVYFISKEVFQEIRTNFFPLIFEKLDEIEKFENSAKDETSIIITNEKYKIISAMITFIKLLYDSMKLVFLCDKNLVPLISQSLVRITRDYANKCSLMIITGELFKTKKIPITQKNICVFISSLMFLNDIFSNIVSNIMKSFTFDCEGFKDVSIIINKIVNNGKQKILEICLECINQSFIIYPLIDWVKDNNPDVKEKSNKFLKQISNLSQVYTSMISYLPMFVVQELLITICNHLIECFNKQINLLPKIDVKANAREFRKLMKNVKMLIEFFKMDNPNTYFDKIDEYIANKAPLKKSEKKEKEDD